MSTRLQLATIDGVRLIHRWQVHAGPDRNAVCAPNHLGLCDVCDRGRNMCSLCGCESDVATSHCSSMQVCDLTKSLIAHGGLDYKNGSWTWKAPRVRFDRETNRIELIESSGSIDRFVAYCGAKSTLFEKRQPGDEQRHLSVSIRHVSMKAGVSVTS